MIAGHELGKLAHARLEDAEALFRARRYDGASYLCGYVVELGLKARICRTLSWAEYPFSRREFKNLQSFKTHDLDVLLRLSGVEKQVKTTLLTEWSAVVSWDPQARYHPTGSVTRKDVALMIKSARRILKDIWINC